MQMDAPASGSETSKAISALRRFVRPPAESRVEDRCELCRTRLNPFHRHLLDPATRQVLCACDPCALRFQSVVNGKFRLIPRDARSLPGFTLTDAQWDSLLLPINLAYFFHHSGLHRPVAMYPGPAGATESLLTLKSWQEIVDANPVLASMEPDVEALLVNRIRTARDSFIVPIDRCFELVGIIRKSWRGLSGGDEVWNQIYAFFGRLTSPTNQGAECQEVTRA